jgi:hypothetical protein
MKSFYEHIEFFSWDFVFAEGDTIKEKYVTLYKTLDSIVAFTRAKEDKPYIIGNFEIISALVVLDGMDIGQGRKIIFEFSKQENTVEDVLHYGHVHSGIRGFEVYQDHTAPKNQILICGKDKLSILNLFNYPI